VSTVVTVVGVGADGWAGLAGPARDALAGADVIVGVARQLALLPDEIAADRVEWPSPLVPAIPAILDEHRDRVLCVLASGDPMFYGIGSTLARRTEIRVIPHVSSASLVCARLGWALEDVDVVSAVARPVERLHASVHHGRRVLVLSENSSTPLAVARLLTARGFGASRMTVVCSVGGPDERVESGIADGWSTPVGPLNIVAVECVAAPEARRLPRAPGLPDDTYEHDGQITKREIRAVTVAALAPEPGLLLWDIGAGRAVSASSGCGRTRPAAPSPSSRARTGPSGSPATPTGWACPTCGSCTGRRPTRWRTCRTPTSCSSAAG